MTNRIVNFYVIIDPRDNGVRYVGKTVHPLDNRLRRHIADAKGYIGRFIKDLISKGHYPVIEKIDECYESDDWQQKERDLIAHYRAIIPNLCNLCNGGYGISGYKRTPEAVEKGVQGRRKKIYTLNIVSGEIKEQPSASQFAHSLNIRQSAVVRAIKTNSRCGDYLISLTRDFQQSHVSKNYQKAVVCTTPEGETIKFKSSNAAGKALSLYPDFIRKVCNNKYSQYKGYKFQYDGNK